MMIKLKSFFFCSASEDEETKILMKRSPTLDHGYICYVCEFIMGNI